MTEAVFLVSLLILYYIYHGYLLLLSGIVFFLSPKNRQVDECDTQSLPNISVLVTAYNEEEHIEARISNILSCDYPLEKLEVVVASDLSTDNTDKKVREYEDKRVKLFRPSDSSGKTDTQNQAVAHLKGNIWIFTDANTSFHSDFIKQVAYAFQDNRAGGVDGHLLFTSNKTSGLSDSQSRYWRHELKLRTYESKIGTLAVASGACLAIRSELFQPMHIGVGEDCLLPLQVVSQGYRMIHLPEAKAEDNMHAHLKAEFLSRVRMTHRNWQGTWLYPQLLNPFCHPGYAWALWSHKILRWLSPFFLSLLTISAVGLSVIYASGWILGLMLIGFYAAGAVGYFSEKYGWDLPIVGTVFSFLLANTGFLTGVIKACFSGKKITSYRN